MSLTPRQLAILEASRERGWVLEPDAKALLAEAGLPVPRGRLARSWEDCLSAARELGWPVVAKVVSPEIVHKTEFQGVELGLGDEPALRAAWERLSALPGALGVLVEEQVQGGVELIAGGRLDAQFGPVLLLGIGGTAVELYRDAALRLAPVEPAEVLRMVEELRGRDLLRGFRGAPPADLQALASSVATFSHLLVELGDRFESADLNPLFALPRGCTVGDARIMLGPAGGR